MNAQCQPVDHLVIGGGLAGSMVAIRLASAGRHVVLLEKECSAHHKVCGEFLSREAVGYLHQVGVEPLNLGAATIRSLRLSSKHRRVEESLPFTALSLSRHKLDEAMLANAIERGCEVQRGVLVEKLASKDNMWIAQLRGGKSVCAQTVFLANGKHDLRGWRRGPGKQGDLIGFKMHWRLAQAQTQALTDLIELFLFPGGYGGLSLLEEGVANLCLVVRRAELHRAGGWSELLKFVVDESPHLQQCLQNGKPMWDRPLAISPIPYGHIAGATAGLWRLGDQAAVIPSFTGDGMAIALHSAALAAQMYLAGENSSLYQYKLQMELSRSVSLASFLSRAMVTDTCQMLAPLGLSVFPSAIQWIARSTRIPERHLLTASCSHDCL